MKEEWSLIFFLWTSLSNAHFPAFQSHAVHELVGQHRYCSLLMQVGLQWLYWNFCRPAFHALHPQIFLKFFFLIFFLLLSCFHFNLIFLFVGLLCSSSFIMLNCFHFLSDLSFCRPSMLFHLLSC